MEVLLFIFIIFYGAIEVVEIKSEIYIKLDQNMTYKEKCKKVLAAIAHGLSEHYSELWNWIDIISIVS